MRISDWSSDVCSSDLRGAALGPARPEHGRRGPAGTRTRTRAGRGARPPRPTHATAMTPENVMNASIDTLAMQHTTTADRAPPHAGIDTTATPMAGRKSVAEVKRV